MNVTKFQIGAEVELFKTNLVGMVDSNSGNIIIKQKKVDTVEGMTIEQFINSIKTLFEDFGVDLPKIDIPEEIQNITQGVNVYLNEIFLLIKTEEPKSLDFAIWVSMDVSEELKKLFPISITKGYVKIWNTVNECIIREMEIGVIQHMLEEKGVHELSEKTVETISS